MEDMCTEPSPPVSIPCSDHPIGLHSRVSLEALTANIRLGWISQGGHLAGRAVDCEFVEADDVGVEDGDAVEVLGHRLLQLDRVQDGVRQEAVEGSLRFYNFRIDFLNFFHHLFG